MRQIADIERQIHRHVEERWAEDVAAEVTGEKTWWPRQYALGRPDAATVADEYDDLIDLVDRWRTWASTHGAAVVESNIRIEGVTYPILSHVLVPSLDVAARVAGTRWAPRLRHAREYCSLIDTRFRYRRNVISKIVRAVVDWAPVDVDLLVRAASWFEESPISGLSPRQVPLEGFHTKWLESRRAVVARLAGLDDLGLLPPHPARIHFTYLDTQHIEAGGRKHDSATVGDAFTPAYPPHLVVICENKDTAIYFPEMPDAIAVEGAGSGAAAFAAFSWLRDAPLVVYWGDMDADGLRILAQFRTAGISAESLFMDVPTYERWEAFGTNTDKRGDAISADSRPAPAHLEHHERALYELLNDSTSARYRRVEQERIPLADAHAAIRQMQAAAATP